MEYFNDEPCFRLPFCLHLFKPAITSEHLTLLYKRYLSIRDKKNYLRNIIVNAPSVAVFKARLDGVLGDKV